MAFAAPARLALGAQEFALSWGTIPLVPFMNGQNMTLALQSCSKESTSSLARPQDSERGDGSESRNPVEISDIDLGFSAGMASARREGFERVPTE
jgi:hypothetical protein